MADGKAVAGDDDKFRFKCELMNALIEEECASLLSARAQLMMQDLREYAKRHGLEETYNTIVAAGPPYPKKEES